MAERGGLPPADSDFGCLKEEYMDVLRKLGKRSKAFRVQNRMKVRDGHIVLIFSILVMRQSHPVTGEKDMVNLVMKSFAYCLQLYAINTIDLCGTHNHDLFVFL